MIDVLTLRGTGEERRSDGVPAGMIGDVARLLDPERFRCFEPDWPAAVAGLPDGWGSSLETSVRRGEKAGARYIIESPNVCGIIAYSLGSIAADRILTGARTGKWKNHNGTPLEIAFVLNIASPVRKRGESVLDLCPPDTFGLHGQRGRWPAVDILEYANPNDIITSVPADSPLRIIDAAISPFALVEGARIGNVTPMIFDRLLDFLALDPAANFARYEAAVRGVVGYLTPWPDGEHVRYSGRPMPGGDWLTWTSHAARHLNTHY